MRFRPRVAVVIGAAGVLIAAVALVWNTVDASPPTLATGSVPALAGHSSSATPSSAAQGAQRAASRGTSAPGGKPVTAPNLDPDQIAGSIGYLQSTYGVSRADAIRRLDLQAEAVAIDTRLRAGAPDVYGGVWLDQDHGGVLRVEATDPAALSSALRGLPDAAHIAVSRVSRTLAQLEALQTTVAARVSPADGAVTIDVPSNQVVIYQRSGGAAAGDASPTVQSYERAEAAPAKPDAALTAIVAAHPGVVLRQMVTGVERSAPVGPGGRLTVACSPQKCAPPLRGGMRLDVKRTTANNDPDNLDPMWGQCTVGFIVYDAAAQKLYALTAGHCVVGSDKTGVTHAYSDSGVEIGYETDYENAAASYPNDYALLTIPDPVHWFGGGPTRTRIYCTRPGGQSCTQLPRDLVDVYCTGVESTGCVSTNIGMAGVALYSSSHVGDVVCATGSGNNDPAHGGYQTSGAQPGTRCGEVTGVNGGFVTNICSRKGDSGGPLFSEVTRQAYGILNDGTPGSGDCPSTNTEWSQYSPVSSILTAVNAQALAKTGSPGQFVLSTTP